MKQYTRSMHKAFVYRLYPTARQAEQLTWILDRCRALYNAALQERRDAYRMAGKSLGYCAQAGELPGLKEACPEYKQVGSQVLQDVLRRVDRAFTAFFRRTKAGQTPGYPRFTGRDRYDSFTYTQAGWRLRGNRLIPHCHQSLPRDRVSAMIVKGLGLSLQADAA